MRALMGGSLIDGTGSPPASDTAVLIDDEGRIGQVGQREAVRLPPGTEVLDISGMTLLPGLIDCHDHLSFHGFGIMQRWGLNEPQSLQHARTTKVLEQTLMSGYTAVRDAAWLDSGFKMAVDEGVILGPRLVLATAPISPTGGLTDFCSPSGHQQVMPVDPLLPLGIANGVDQVRATVREVVRSGADVIKFFTTGGASARPGHGPKDMAFGPDEIRTLVDEARALGKRTMCHALGGQGLRMAVEAGVDSIEHGTYLDEQPELLKIMADRGTFFCPTFTVYIFHGERGTPHGQERARALREHHVESLQRALAAGVKVVAGTDAGAWVHGNNAQELQCLVEAGMMPMQAIVSGTGLAAECLGLGNEVGTVQPGKAADLVVVDGDPLGDITILQDQGRIKLVMKGGDVCRNDLAIEGVRAL